MNLSKSRYTRGVQCPKMLWMEAHMPEHYDDSVMNQAVLDTGSMVGDLAMGYFGDFVEIPFDASDMDGMARKTQELLDAATPIICEATFVSDGCLCMVDILLNEPDGVRIVEVKSSTHVAEIYLHDMAFQTWVLDRCGLKVKSVSLMHLDASYVRQGDIDLHRLFCVEDCTQTVFEMVPEVGGLVEELKKLADSPEEPAIAFGPQCDKPYECGYQGWCWRNVPSPSVFDLCRITAKKSYELFGKGIVTFQDLVDSKVKLSARQSVQVRCEVERLDQLVDTGAVAEFLGSLSYPLYFLDFETYQPAIPPFDGTRPYQQIPTQYSLHIMREPGGPLEHREFLAQAGVDPRRAVAEHLVQDITPDGCILAYNTSFEKTRITELADAFPDLSTQLLAMTEHMDDLMKPFNNGSFYARAMGGSNSIKYVLPALFPNDPDLDYHELEGVHNGSEAMVAFAQMESMNPEEVEQTRENLLRYCELDTLAMVKIWQKLVAECGK